MMVKFIQQVSFETGVAIIDIFKPSLWGTVKIAVSSTYCMTISVYLLVVLILIRKETVQKNNNIC